MKRLLLAFVQRSTNQVPKDRRCQVHQNVEEQFHRHNLLRSARKFCCVALFALLTIPEAIAEHEDAEGDQDQRPELLDAPPWEPVEIVQEQHHADENDQRGTDGFTFTETFERIVEHLLAVPCRESEAAAMRWSNVDLVNRTWLMPTSKNSLPHRFFLNDHAIAILEARREVAGEVSPSPDASAVSSAIPPILSAA